MITLPFLYGRDGGNRMTYEEKTVKTHVIHEGVITDYLIKEVELPGGQIATREIVHHKPAAAALAITDEGKALFVKQFRKAIEQSIYEIPAGLIDPGESPLLAAQRELFEETGYVADHWEKITEFYTSVGFCDEKITIYHAKGLEKRSQQLDLDDGEFLEVFELTFDQAMEKYQAGEMPDSKTVAALMYWKMLRN